MKKFSHIVCLLTMATWALVTSCSTNHDSKTVNQSEADSLCDVMCTLFDESKFAESAAMIDRVFEMYEELQDTVGMSDVLATAANTYTRMGKFPEALNYAQRALQLDSILNDAALLSSDCNTLAGLYLAEGSTKQAEAFILNSIEWEKKTDNQPNISIRYGMASEIYGQLKQYDKAISYATQALEIAKERKDTAQMGKRMVQLADAYVAADRLPEAGPLYRRYLQLPEHHQAKTSIAITHRQLGVLAHKQGNNQEAIEHFEKATALARETGFQTILCGSLQQLGNLYAQSKPEYAVKLLQESRTIADTLHSHNVAEMMEQYAARYDKQTKERIITEQQQELRFQRIVLMLLGVALVLLIIAIVIFINLRRIRRHKQQIETRLSEQVVAQTQHVETQISAADQEFLDHLATYVEQHLHESDLSSITLASEFCVSQRQFSRRIKLLMGIDTTHYVRSSRILRAKQLLLNPELSISDIFTQCGFESLNYFSRVFRQDVGITPTEYRKQALHT